MSSLTNYLDTDILELFEGKNLTLESQNVDIENPSIDVKNIAKMLGCTIQYEVLTSRAGSHDFASKIITINAFDPEYRQRFTIAHEIGHNVYDHEGVRNRITEDQHFIEEDRTYADLLMERQANNFASRLLMPEKLVEEVIDQMENLGLLLNNRQKITKLAEKFNVSYISMEYRLRALNKL